MLPTDLGSVAMIDLPGIDLSPECYSDNFHDHDLLKSLTNLAAASRRLLDARQGRQSDLCRQGQGPARPGARLFQQCRRTFADSVLGAAGRRHRHPGHQQRQGSADPRKQSDQAVQAALQHPAQRRQELSEHQSDDAASLAAHFGDAQDRQGRQPLLRAVLVGGGGARDHRHHREAFSAAQLHRSQLSQSQPALLAVSDQTLHGALRAAGVRGDFTASRCARRCCLSTASSSS